MTEPLKRLIGKVTVVHPKGFFFISCKDMPFIRIYAHWTALIPQTINFKELKVGDEVEFSPIETKNQGWRAIKIDVLEHHDAIVKEDE